jgi:hypothetical protein
MNTSAVLMMVLGCSIVWGGLLISIGVTLKKEKENRE